MFEKGSRHTIQDTGHKEEDKFPIPDNPWVKE
jgi:hypothetical protein